MIFDNVHFFLITHIWHCFIMVIGTEALVCRKLQMSARVSCAFHKISYWFWLWWNKGTANVGGRFFPIISLVLHLSIASSFSSWICYLYYSLHNHAQWNELLIFLLWCTYCYVVIVMLWIFWKPYLFLFIFRLLAWLDLTSAFGSVMVGEVCFLPRMLQLLVAYVCGGWSYIYTT